MSVDRKIILANYEPYVLVTELLGKKKTNIVTKYVLVRQVKKNQVNMLSASEK